jgi:hypothetical protein
LIEPTKLRTVISSKELDWNNLNEQLQNQIHQESLNENLQTSMTTTAAADLFITFPTKFLINSFIDIKVDGESCTRHAANTALHHVHESVALRKARKEKNRRRKILTKARKKGNRSKGLFKSYLHLQEIETRRR